MTCGKDNLLRLVDVRTFEVRSTLSAPTFVVGGAWATACLAPSEALAAAGSADGSVLVWELGGGRSALAAKLREGGGGTRGGPGDAVVACAWSPAGFPMGSCTKGGTVTFWGGK